MNDRNNDRKALKSGIWYTVSNFLVKGIGFITTPIFARLLSQAEYGQYSNFLSWQNIFMILITLTLEASIVSAQYDFREKVDEYILSMLILSTVSVCVWFCFFVFFENRALDVLGLEAIYVKLLLLYLLFVPAVNLFQARERVRFRYKISVILSLILSVGASFLAVVLVFVMKDRLYGRIVGQLLPAILIGGCLYIYFGVKGKHISLSYWGYALKICLPYVPHLLSLTVLNSTDRIMIKRWCGDENAALYSLAYTCGAMVTVLFSSINSAYAPWLAERLSVDDYVGIRRTSRYYIYGGISLAIGIMLLAPEALLILGGNRYLEAKYVIPPVFMGCVCQFFYTMFVNVEQIKKRTIGMAFASISAALLNYLLNWMLIPRIGYLAAAYTTLVGYLWLLLVHMVLVRQMGMSKIYDCKCILLLVILGCILTVGINFLYHYNVLRGFIIIVYLLVSIGIIYKQRKNFIRIIKLIAEK